MDTDRYGMMVVKRNEVQKRMSYESELRGKVSDRDLKHLDDLKNNYCYPTRIQKLHQAKSQLNNQNSKSRSVMDRNNSSLPSIATMTSNKLSRSRQQYFSVSQSTQAITSGPSKISD